MQKRTASLCLISGLALIGCGGSSGSVQSESGTESNQAPVVGKVAYCQVDLTTQLPEKIYCANARITVQASVNQNWDSLVSRVETPGDWVVVADKANFGSGQTQHFLLKSGVNQLDSFAGTSYQDLSLQTPVRESEAGVLDDNVFRLHIWPTGDGVVYLNGSASGGSEQNLTLSIQINGEESETFSRVEVRSNSRCKVS